MDILKVSLQLPHVHRMGHRIEEALAPDPPVVGGNGNDPRVAAQLFRSLFKRVVRIDKYGDGVIAGPRRPRHVELELMSRYHPFDAISVGFTIDFDSPRYCNPPLPQSPHVH